MFLFAAATCSVWLTTHEASYQQLLYKLDLQQYPHFEDDLDTESLVRCAVNQIHFLEKQPPDTMVHYGKDFYSINWLTQSTEELIRQFRKSKNGAELNDFIKNNYIIYQAGGRKDQPNREMLITGYYEPVFEGSLMRQEPYLTPIYSRPDNLITRRTQDTKTAITGRYDENKVLVDYWSREEIETKGHLRGYEMAYFRDPFDAFLLHVQGSGKIRLPDGSMKSVGFAASNGRTYNSIGKLLVDSGIMPLEEVTIPAIRQYLNEHPHHLQRTLHHNPRYIFFSWSDNRGPRGSSGEVLTPGRSVAIDTSSLPMGSTGYITSQRPVTNSNNEVTGWTPMARFVFPQDSGAAIKGSGRLDMFWGHGDYARIAANHMKEKGKLFFLVKKGYLSQLQ